ncbi:MAG: PAS domain S-box protein [Bacteroidetes bacterium]|nr:PAS domain S-box protein [Bacteroidota bacterium]
MGTIEKKLTSGIAFAIGFVLMIVVLSIWQYRRIQENGMLLRHTNLVLYNTQQVLSSAVQYELNIKNYLLTGDSVFLRRADDSMASIRPQVAELKRLTSDNSSQQPRLDSLLFYIDNNHGSLVRAIEESRARSLGIPRTLITTSATSGYSARVHQWIDSIVNEEQRLLEDRRVINQRRASQLQFVLWALIVSVVALGVITFRKITIDLANERRAREQLRRFNSELKEQVEIQTANLQASEDKYKTLFYKSPLPKWIYDENTLAFLEVNDKAIEMYGYSQEEFRAMTLKDIRPAEDIPELMEEIEDVRKHPDIYRGAQWRHVKKSGEVIDVLVSGHTIEVQGKKARMVAIVDITERRRHEKQMRTLNLDLAKRASELAASNAELERFAYIASHDLQEPLRMVSSFLQLLQKRYGGHLDSKADQYIHYAVDGAERMKALIMDLLEYSRVGTAKEGFGKVDVNTVLAEVGDVFREKIISAQASIDIGPMPCIWGDKVQVSQLFQNLVSNALKYHSDKAPVIVIRAKEEPLFWRFSIEDNGIGIESQFFDKIFIIFQRLHNKSEYSGTGIGLAICKKIVERHGGKIWVESSPEKGSTFYFTISKKV